MKEVREKLEEEDNKWEKIVSLLGEKEGKISFKAKLDFLLFFFSFLSLKSNFLPPTILKPHNPLKNELYLYNFIAFFFFLFIFITLALAFLSCHSMERIY